jgi:ADP-ribose pyrophosphatase YjhB (NUDIX family)
MAALSRDYPDRPIVGVGAVIIDGARAVVVRRASEPLAGAWSIPGGVLELGETLRDGVAREALEETGLAVEVRDVLGVFDRILPDREGRTQFHYVLIDFLCVRLSGELRAASDASEVRWLTAAELDTFPLSDGAASVIRKGLAAVAQEERERTNGE